MQVDNYQFISYSTIMSKKPKPSMSSVEQFRLHEEGFDLSGVYTKAGKVKDRFTGMFKPSYPGDRMLDDALVSITTGRSPRAISQVGLPHVVEVTHVDPAYSVDLSESPTLELPLAATPVVHTNK